jgi:hypothetical protein
VVAKEQLSLMAGVGLGVLVKGQNKKVLAASTVSLIVKNISNSLAAKTR